MLPQCHVAKHGFPQRRRLTRAIFRNIPLFPLRSEGLTQVPSAKAWAQVAELVDALASGASGRKVVEVRVFSWAPSAGFVLDNERSSFERRDLR